MIAPPSTTWMALAVAALGFGAAIASFWWRITKSASEKAARKEASDELKAALLELGAATRSGDPNRARAARQRLSAAKSRADDNGIG